MLLKDNYFSITWSTFNISVTRANQKCFAYNSTFSRSSVRAGRAVGGGVSALPGQMIASSSVTLRARSSRSACKSWNICKLTSYQRAVTGGTVWGGGNTSPSPGAARDCSQSLSPLWGTVGVCVPPPLTFDPCLKLTLPQASYSPWIPIIVSRIKTLSAKIFSASLIWCIPSPCEDRYSRQGKEHKPKNCSPRCKSFVSIRFSS